LRILLITPAFPPDASGIASRTYGLARAWTDAGHQVTVITRNPTHLGFKNRLVRRQTLDGIEVINLWTWASRDPITHRPSSFVIAGLLHAVRLPKPDLVVSTALPQSIAILGRLLSRGVPHLLDVSSTSSPPHTKMGSPLQRVTKRLLRSAGGVLVPTQDLAKSLGTLGIQDACVAADGADLKRFNPPTNAVEFRRQHGFTGKFVVGLQATGLALDSLKSVRNAAAQTAVNPNIAWFCVATSRERAILCVRPDGLPAANVVVIKPLQHQDLPTFWSACDTALITTDPELGSDLTIPIEAFEAMAMRRPILGMRSGATQTLVEHAKAGLTTTTTEGLVEAVHQLVAHPEQAASFGSSGRAYVEQHHDQRLTARASLRLLAAHGTKKS
jgi:colanic acid biosynthesis glycosyl transferase WcaI